ncbi:hypothetical protein LSH36_1706g00022 [Paralvinella palmiformis]|uniref:Glutamate receptor n=1 Tax=Paralvinella palmiformis TaxID=53620 RepID=A0AAD9IRC7_9ANNE|nr:hypothetical protein LSH36_1706g00022 [Paralvinella palmiformis]
MINLRIRRAAAARLIKTTNQASNWRLDNMTAADGMASLDGNLLGLLEDYRYGNLTRLSRAINQWNLNHTLHVSYDSMVTSYQTTDVDMLQFVSRMSCSGALAILSLSPCDSRLIQTLSFSRIPAIVLNPRPVCFASISHARDVILLPPYWKISDAISSFVDGHHRRIIVIYDQTADPHLTTLIASLEKNLSHKPVISSVYVREDTWPLVLDDFRQIDPDQTLVSHYTLYLLWADVVINRRILRQVRRIRISGWYILIVCPNRQHFVNMTAHISKIMLNDMAFLLINKQNTLYPDVRLQDLIHALAKAANTTTSPGYDVFFGDDNDDDDDDDNNNNNSNNTTSCFSRNKAHLADVIMSYLPSASVLPTCRHYEVYTANGNDDNPQLVSEHLCQNGVIRTNLDIFPRRGLSGKHLRINTMESSPFVVITGHRDAMHFGGMAIEMLEELARRLNFTYTLSRVPDGQFGNSKPDGNWTGLIGQLQRKEVDMCVASLSVTEQRKTVIDFVEYYFEYGAAIMKKPDEDENKWRVILQPFRWHVWVCLVFSVPFAGLVAWIISVFVYKLNKKKEDSFVDAKNSTWYIFGALLTQGGSFLPHSASGRTFICSWWFFSIIVVATYGGSLIAYLTISKLDAPFDDLEGLVRQDRYKWGFKEGTVYYTAFKSATGGVYHQLWEGVQKFSKNDPRMMTRSIDKQLAMVKQGRYVLIMDRTPLLVQVISDHTCELVLLSETFMPLPFGIGLQKNSPYKAAIYEGVKLLRQSGLLKHWEKKWWPKQSCSGIPMPESHKITLMDAQSAFYLLLVGITVASFVLFGEQVRKQVKKLVKKQRMNLSVTNGSLTSIR